MADSSMTMSGSSSSSSKPSILSEESELINFRNLLWGISIKLDVFERWSQGFEFSDVEPSALVQKQGGPCGIIAPVQAFLLKILLIETPGHSFRDLTPEKCKRLLIQALCNILMKCKTKMYRIVTLPELSIEAKEDFNFDDVSGSMASTSTASSNYNRKTNRYKSKPQTYDYTPTEFHERLSVLSLQNIDDVEQYYADNFHVLTGKYGVLLFMYTVLMTRGIDNIMSELLDASEPLIHGIYGHGSQALINLMLTGRAVAHVWDHDQDVGGLKLRGINQQSDIGFITLMEQMRYCTVGSFYKNPKNPVWIMASETHLTVLFSNEKRLVSPETPNEVARRVFKSFDPEGNNFISSPVLQDVLQKLGLVSEPEYVEIMEKKLDPESLGIILLNNFLEEFYPEDKRSLPDTFDLLHYNGIPGSNPIHKVKYNKGSAILLESDLKMYNTSNPILTCLQTKWPTIDVNWNDDIQPSLN